MSEISVIPERKIVRVSDEGYGSDLSPSKTEPDEKNGKLLIKKESEEFKAKYFVKKILYNSANGVVYEGHRREDGISVCIKQVPRSRIAHYAKLDGRSLPLEFVMHIRAAKSSTGVVKVFNWYERRTSFVLVMERPKNSIDLFELSAKYGALSEEPAKIIFKQLVLICKDLKEGGIFHRDIKDENILVNTQTLEVKLIDFGCATEFDCGTIYTTASGTPEFFPPETFVKSQYCAEPATVWALGTLLYVIVMGDIPFQKTENIVRGQRENNLEELLSDNCRSLLNNMMNIDESKRFNLSSILSSSWLEDAAMAPF